MNRSHAPAAALRVSAAVVLAGFAVAAPADAAPPIRTSAANPMPACVTPDKLMAFLEDRNTSLDPRYRDIARWYQHWGNVWRVRWDYAFFQMLLETNYLKYRRGDGRRGDVHEKQYNFAGIGATGGGVAGNRFPDVKTGVHAQIQHLVAYSGERIQKPIADRTELKQDDIIEQSRRLNRAVTFGDLARRWAADRKYAKSIDFVAGQFQSGYCSGTSAARAGTGPGEVPRPQPALRPIRDSGRDLGREAFAPPSGLGGPTPAKLAGPDTLPWTDAQATTGGAPQPGATPNSEPNDAPDSGPPSAQQPKKPSGPVRTIWSRDGNVDRPAAAAKKPAAQQAKPAPKTESANAAPAEPGDAPLLPTFRITPMKPEPSRLGGPVPVPTLLNAAPSGDAEPGPTPRMQFKEIIGAPSAPAPSASTGPCRVLAASYGGSKTLLVRAAVNGETRYTALTVLDGFEKTMFDTYAKASGAPGEVVGEYASKDAALADARTNCPGG